MDPIVTIWSRFSVLQRLAFYYLAALMLLVYGYGIGKYKFFPYELFHEVYSYAVGHPEGLETTLLEKIQNDFGAIPTRSMVSYEPDNARKYREIVIPAVRERREKKGMVYLTDQAAVGYRVIFGTFDFEDGLHGAILLDSSGVVVHKWVVHERDYDWEIKHAETNIFPHGMEILPDGSIVVSFDGGSSIQRIDWCGERIWAKAGGYDHSIAYNEAGYLWALDDFIWLRKISAETGEVVQSISFFDVMETNSDIDIFGLRQEEYADNYTWTGYRGDYWHTNDVEPLTVKMAESFPNFSVGDLLISMRSINLLFVLDPDTLKVKWWRIGQTRRQHDPDWQLDGSITVYDNNMHRTTSRITRINPADYSSEILYDGVKEDFYSRIRGKHQMLPNANILITISQQGRVLEVTNSGEVAFEFINQYRSKNNAKLLISEARYLPIDFFTFKEAPKCKD